jgi:alanyl-tRNA synthetase
MRRAIRYGTRVGLDEPFFHDVCALVVERFAGAYPELREAAPTIDEVVRTEESSFRRTLGRGLRRLETALETMPKASDGEITPFPIGVAAELYDTYGFPIDLTGVIAREHGLVLDEDAVDDEVRRRQGADEQRFAGGDAGIAELWYTLAKQHAVSFVGYTDTELIGARILALVQGGAVVDAVMGVGTEVDVIVDRTPFYGESGGQVGDCGRITSEQGAALEVFDTIKPTGGLVVHRARIVAGALRADEPVTLRVDTARRDAIRRNHSATHLLHHALREVLGPHVVQKGSLVNAERLRFDFSHGRPVTEDEKRSIEERVAAMILRNASTHVAEMGMSDAKAAGAIGLFGEKYGDVVRVVRIARDSVELCGGTHVERSGDIGALFIVAEGGIAQGVRRIEAVTGHGAVVHAQRMARIVASASARLHAASGDELLERLEKLQLELKSKDKDIAELRRALAVGGASGGDDVVEVAGVKLLAKALSSADPKAMRDAADAIRDKLRSGVVVLAGEREGKATLLVAVTKDLEGRVHAGRLVGALAEHVGGRGGGRPDLAQAGGSLPSGIPAALAAAPAALAAQLAMP